MLEAGGYVSGIPTPPPNSYRISYYFKANNATTWDYASVASDEGISWAVENGYTDVTSQVKYQACLLPTENVTNVSFYLYLVASIKIPTLASI